MIYFEIRLESVFKNARTTSLCFLEQTTRTTSSAANDYAPSSSCADDIAPSCLDDRHCARHARVHNQSEESSTSSSLKIEEVEEGQCCNQDGCHTGIEPGACSSKSGT